MCFYNTLFAQYFVLCIDLNWTKHKIMGENNSKDGKQAAYVCLETFIALYFNVYKCLATRARYTTALVCRLHTSAPAASQLVMLYLDETIHSWPTGWRFHSSLFMIKQVNNHKSKQKMLSEIITFFPHHNPGSTNILLWRVRSLIVENSKHGRYLKHYCIIMN